MPFTHIIILKKILRTEDENYFGLLCIFQVKVLKSFFFNFLFSRSVEMLRISVNYNYNPVQCVQQSKTRDSVQ